MAWTRSRQVRKKIGDIEWYLAPGMKQSQLPVIDELYKSFGRHDRGQIQGKSRAETIFTVKTNRPGVASELFIKLYRGGGVFQSLKSLLGASPAARDWKMAQEHSRRGLPVAAHLARGLRRRSFFPVDEYLIQESLTSFESFDVFFKTTFRPEIPGMGPQEKRRVIRELAGLIRSMHDRGISRPGIEPRNIMAAPRSGGGVRMVFVDLHMSRLRRGRRGFTVEERVKELAGFHRSFSPLLSQGYRIRFYREYFSPDELAAGQFQELVKKIIDLSGKMAGEAEPRIVKSVIKRSEPFFWFDAGPRRIYLRKPLYQNSLLELADKLEDLKERDRVRVKQVGGLPPRELLVVKCRARNRMPFGLRSAAAWAFMASALMDHHGVPHYRVLAAVEKKGEPHGFVLAGMPGRGEYSLADYLARRVAEEFSGLSWDRRFLIRLAGFVVYLHELGWGFDPPSGESLWVRHTEAGAHELRLFSLQDLRPLGSGDGAARLKNLFELWRVLPISRADGIMLANEYLRFSRALSKDRDKWIRKFMEWQVDSMEGSGE